MRIIYTRFILITIITTTVACSVNKGSQNSEFKPLAYKDSVILPKPFATKSVVNNSKIVGWPVGLMPKAPEGLKVSLFADSLDNPRWIYTAPNGDIFVSLANTIDDGFIKTANMKKPGLKSSNTIILLRDKNNDGIPELKKTFLKGLNRPLGMLILNGKFYVANTNGLWTYDYTNGQEEIKGEGKKILDLPAGGYNNHWTRNIIANQDGTKIYISVGSGSNVAENGIANEVNRACILEINPDGSGQRIYASGLRNPVGMGWSSTNVLWTAVNERDGLGDDLVPDYTTSVKENAFYGWPYAYFGKNPDPRMKGEKMDLVNSTLVPDVSLGSHTASLGLAFNNKNGLGNNYKDGMFIGQHGSWNRTELSGYKVVFVPFKNGKPSGPKQDFLTGFIANIEGSLVYGRPVGVAFSKNGSLLIADDAGKKIWRVSKQ
ncbi:L-sorbosone dehydrogenase [Pedobacter psychrophilus]|uniref:L-sorbosone dehydrogenase n=1 Tax=Pedobacter psychrophilus TaxID=1826909 RepID=A0A179DES9_9SPHI|nr:sorbosone dehydrogenase family protein [Pedobacter psychrophilus]OAQ38999.1 L-sorbosone dehydrogenase [Pedobacter psychrophilus]